MFRLSGILSIMLAIFFGFLLFLASQSVQNLESEYTKARKQLIAEEQSISILSAEWDYLNRPQRLERLAQSALSMKSENSFDFSFFQNSRDINGSKKSIIPLVKPSRKHIVNTSLSKTNRMNHLLEEKNADDFQKMLNDLESVGGL